MTAPRHTDILIVGSGFSGLIMAMTARKHGFTDIAILEKAQEIGGTWRDNTYPGVACDVPSHLYSFASHPNPNWSTCYAGGAEILAYMQDVARREGLYELCHFGQTLTSARWLGDRWEVQTSGGVWQARVLVSAIGALHVPLIPRIEGADSFPGPAFHSAEWRHDVDLSGKRVAVVGTGASAVQFVPEIAGTAAQVTIFQRTPPYVLPRPDGPIAPWVRRLYARWPLLPRLRRAAIFATFEMRHAIFRGKPLAQRFGMNMWRKTLTAAIPDAATQDTLTPDYQMGCKRVLSSNRWYRALTRDTVTVLPEAVARIDGSQLRSSSGQVTEADVLIWGTGFHVTDALSRVAITGADGLTLAEAWSDGLKAHLGTGVAGFPNLFFLLGPHTGLGHNSVVLMIEAQAAHIGRMLDTMRQRGVTAIAPRPDRQAEFESDIAKRLEDTVWQAGGCTSWYQDDQGRNPTLWPGTVRAFQRRMAQAGPDEYHEVAIPSASEV